MSSLEIAMRNPISTSSRKIFTELSRLRYKTRIAALNPSMGRNVFINFNY
jgi:hypothetical protein